MCDSRGEAVVMVIYVSPFDVMAGIENAYVAQSGHGLS